jgi:hypothetical protein
MQSLMFFFPFLLSHSDEKLCECATMTPLHNDDKQHTVLFGK